MDALSAVSSTFQARAAARSGERTQVAAGESIRQADRARAADRAEFSAEALALLAGDEPDGAAET